MRRGIITQLKLRTAEEESFAITSLRPNLPTSKEEHFTLQKQNYVQYYPSAVIIYRSIFLMFSPEEFYPLRVLLKLLS